MFFFFSVIRAWFLSPEQTWQTQVATQVTAEISFIHLAAEEFREMTGETCALTIWYSCHQSCLLLQSLGKS